MPNTVRTKSSSNGKSQRSLSAENPRYFLAKGHGISRNFLCIWIAGYEWREFGAERKASDHPQQFEAGTVALKRQVDRQRLNIGCLTWSWKARREQ